MKYYIFNVKLQSDTREGYDKYIELFTQSFENREPIYLNGDKQAVLREYFKNKLSQTTLYNKHLETIEDNIFFYGNITKFTRITNKKWINIQTNEIEENNELPKNLFPNADDVEFFFFPQIHRMFIKHGKIGAKPLNKFVNQFFAKGEQLNEKLIIHIEQDAQAIEIIKTAQELHRLEISITPTNDDPLGVDIQKFIDKDTKDSKSKGIVICYKDSKSKQGLIFTPLMEALSFLAKKNGEIMAKIVRNGRKETINTVEHPNFIEVHKEKGMERKDIGIDIFNNYNRED